MSGRSHPVKQSEVDGSEVNPVCVCTTEIANRQGLTQPAVSNARRWGKRLRVERVFPFGKKVMYIFMDVPVTPIEQQYYKL
jgi:hypothetical protein